MEGQHIGHFQVLGELGRGAMAVVWRVWDPRLEREVALKESFIPATATTDERQELAERFVREGCAAAGLNHPGIVTIYSSEAFEGRPVIVMELIEGETLTQALSRRAITPVAAINIADQLLSAVGYAHSRGIIHRDIKPDNVFVLPDGRVKLTDFGIAHVGTLAGLTQQGTVMGTPGYMSPEQIQGAAVDHRTDLFAVGVILYEMLAGRNPFGVSEGESATTVMYRIVHEVPLPLDPAVVNGLPVSVVEVLRVALAKDPFQRFPDAVSFQAALRGTGPASLGTGPLPVYGTGPVPAYGTGPLSLSPGLQPTQYEMAQPSSAGRSAPGGGQWWVYAAIGAMSLVVLVALTLNALSPTVQNGAAATSGSESTGTVSTTSEILTYTLYTRKLPAVLAQGARTHLEAQSFKVSSVTRLTSLRFKVSNAGQEEYLECAIYPATDGGLGGAILSSSSTKIAHGDKVDATFRFQNLVLTPGEYLAVLRPKDGVDTGISLFTNEDNPYADGARAIYDGSKWQYVSAEDLPFAVGAGD